MTDSTGTAKNMHELEYCYKKSILSYYPSIGDMIIWSGWFSTWYGFLKYTKEKETCVCVFSALPLLLVADDDSYKHIKELKLNDIKNSKNGRFTIIRNSQENDFPIWFI
jgi:hypothetical protein